MSIKSKIENCIKNVTSENTIGFSMSIDRIIFYIPKANSSRVLAVAYVRNEAREPSEDSHPTDTMTEEEASHYDYSKEHIELLKTYLDDVPYFINTRLNSTSKAIKECVKFAHFALK